MRWTRRICVRASGIGQMVRTGTDNGFSGPCIPSVSSTYLRLLSRRTSVPVEARLTYGNDPG